MKIISIDIETTGLNYEDCQILEIGAIMFDTNLGIDQLSSSPKYKCVVNHNKISGESYAINMNSRIFKILANVQDIKNKKDRIEYREKHNILNPSQVANDFWNWLYVNNYTDGIELNVNQQFVKYKDASVPAKKDKIYLNVCGKNFSSFDNVFLKNNIPGWSNILKARTRVLDPASLFLEDDDTQLPGLPVCMIRAGIMNRSVTHDALQDAIDTAHVSIIGLNKLNTK